MKYSNYIGAVAAVLVIASCFLPWVYIASIQTTVTGLKAPHTNFGMPGLMNILFSVLCICFFLVNNIGAKRANLFFCALNLAWSIRNYLLLSQCQMGECPEKKLGMYAILIFSVAMMVMSLFPNMKLNTDKSLPLK
jgi:phosphatidylserine synthase